MGVVRGASGFIRHRGLIALSAGGAVTETALLAGTVPAARVLGPQLTALPPLAAYHDLRWLFVSGLGWLPFLALLAAIALARAGLDTAMVALAWPRGPGNRPVNRPGGRGVYWSCLVLTLLTWLVLSPAVTLMFGVAVLPFSWPFLAAVPILLGTLIAFSHGGVGRSWWGRLPAAQAVGWTLAGFVMLSLAAALAPHLNLAGLLALAALAGLGNAWSWYRVCAALAEVPVPRFGWLPVAPLAAVAVIAIVVLVARLGFTGTLHLVPQDDGPGTAPAAVSRPAGQRPPGSALLVVAGWGSNCCQDGDALAAAEPGMPVRQFSYLGLSGSGQPRPYQMAPDLPIQRIGDMMASQVRWLARHDGGRPVDIIAESEGTLGLYAMLARHRGLPVRSVVLLSPIVDPGRADPAGVPGEALATLDHLIGKMSPYGPGGASALIQSVSVAGARYFTDLTRHRPGFSWLTIVPLADAVAELPCPYPANLVVVNALHGGLLGDPAVLGAVTGFLGGRPVTGDGLLRGEAELIAGAAVAWRIPDLHAVC